MMCSLKHLEAAHHCNTTSTSLRWSHPENSMKPLGACQCFYFRVSSFVRLVFDLFAERTFVLRLFRKVTVFDFDRL